MVIANLRTRWRHRLVVQLLERWHGSFPEMRQWIKTKAPELKLSSRAELDNYPMHKILSIEDFISQERLLAFSVLGTTVNFRRATWLEDITDASGMLRLKERIPQLEIKTTSANPDTFCEWQSEVRGEEVRLWPEVGSSAKREAAAKKYADAWGTDGGELCFTMPLDKLEELHRAGLVCISYHALDYPEDSAKEEANAALMASTIECHHLLEYPNAAWKADKLKDVLQEYGVAKSGGKKEVLKKLAQYAAKLYQNHEGELDGYFGRKRFVRVPEKAYGSRYFTVLENELGGLQQLVLAAYIILHLRGGVLLEAEHKNDAYTVQQLMESLVTGQVDWKHSLIEIPSPLPQSR